MRFTDDSLYSENMAPLIITAALYGPAWLPGDPWMLPGHRLPLAGTRKTA